MWEEVEVVLVLWSLVASTSAVGQWVAGMEWRAWDSRNPASPAPGASTWALVGL